MRRRWRYLRLSYRGSENDPYFSFFAPEIALVAGG